MKVKITVPDNWSQVTVQQWMDGEAARKSNISELQKAKKLVGIMCKVDDVDKLTTSTLTECLQHMMWMQEEIDLSTDRDVIPFFHINGTRYGFIPDFTKLSTGEFIDLDGLTTKGWSKHLPELMAILYRPVTQEVRHMYEIQPYHPSRVRNELMKQAPMDACLSALVFFSRIGRKLVYDLHKSSQAEKSH